MLAFRCLTKENNWMEVVVNNSTGKTYWIKEKEEHIFNDWTKYLQKAACIIRLNAANNLCEQPDEISKTINIKGKDCFSVKSMKGDWLEINIPVEQISDFDKQAKAKSFWLRWKKGNDILIKYTNGT